MIHVADSPRNRHFEPFSGLFTPSGQQISAESGRGQPLSGTREAWVAPNVHIPRQSGPPDPAGAKLVCVPASGIASLPMSRPRRPGIEAMRGRKRSTRRFAEPLSLRKTLRTFSPIFQFPQTRRPAMNFIGVDLHKKSITICVMDEKRKILARKTLPCTQTNEIVEFFRQFRPFKVVVEATASYVWFVELVEPLAEKIVLANPKKL